MKSALVTRSFGREYTVDFKEAIRREWVITNGLGGYAGSSLIGANTRKHHGLLIASLHAPTQRMVVLNRIAEKVILGEEEYSFSSVQRSGHKYENGYIYQTNFSFDAIPSFSYYIKGVHVEKTVALEYGKNTVAIGYEIKNEGEPCVLELIPAFNFRDHNEGSKKADLKFCITKRENNLFLVPKNNPNIRIAFYTNEGAILPNEKEDVFDKRIELQTEIDTGMSSKDTGFMPCKVQIGVGHGERKKISIICSIEENYTKDAFAIIEGAKKRAESIVLQSGFSDDFLKTLAVSADNFVTDRESTAGKTILAGLPWFTDWGRDTMISFTGLVLETGRFEDAKSILKTFTKYEKNGLLPNMFPDDGVEPIYNTADASLWYFYCVYKYLEYVNTKEAYDFVKYEIYPCLKKILAAYENGTDFSIHMDKDGLIHAGSDKDQVTWMDVRINGFVVTPRHGKPVEINALWINALKITAKLAVGFGEEEYGKQLEKKAEFSTKSFRGRFWNESAGCLYDVVDEINDATGEIADNECIRPNQIWAVSLPYSVIERDKECSVVKVVLEKLCVDYGLRTLPEDDPMYHGVYFGKLSDRDMAYHQGTAWAFPMGGLITAYLKVNDYSREAAAFAMDLLKPMKNHLNDGCIGGIAEIFDGDAPHISRGCYTQAWSVGEILRAYAETLRIIEE